MSKYFVSRLATFQGAAHEDVNDWLDQFDRVAIVQEWTEELKCQVFPLYLGGTALAWYSSSTPAVQDAWTDLKAGLIEAFKPVNYQGLMDTKLRQRRQANDETVIQYFYDVKRLCDKVDPAMPETSKISHILEGLLPYYAERVIPLQPDTCDDLLKKLQLVQQARDSASRAKPLAADPLPALAVGTSVTPSLDEIRKIIRDEIGQALGSQSQGRPSQGSRRVPIAERRCWACNQVGHLKRNCPQRGASSASDSKN